MTALHWAVAHGDTNIAKLLLENGADSTIRNSYGNNPLETALEMDRQAIAEMLGNKQENVNIPNRSVPPE